MCFASTICELLNIVIFHYNCIPCETGLKRAKKRAQRAKNLLPAFRRGGKCASLCLLLIVETCNYNKTNAKAKCLRHSICLCPSIPPSVCPCVKLPNENYISNAVGLSSALLHLLPSAQCPTWPDKINANGGGSVQAGRGCINYQPWTLTGRRKKREKSSFSAYVAVLMITPRMSTIYLTLRYTHTHTHTVKHTLIRYTYVCMFVCIFK